MRRAAWSVLLLFGAAVAGADDKKDVIVELDGLKSKAPADWKSEKPASNLRLMQFLLARADGDKEDAEVQIFQDAGGTFKDNLARWKAQFAPPEGKSIDDVTKVTETKIGGLKADMVEITGTYKSPSFDPKYKGAKVEGFRLVAIQFKGPEHLYQIKLIGPVKTIEKYKPGFDEWLKNFKSDK
jgi:hypothetical protein